MKKFIQKLFWNWDLLRTLAKSSAYHSREASIQDLVSRISIKKLLAILQEAYNQGEKFTTIARLLEDNYRHLEQENIDLKKQLNDYRSKDNVRGSS